MFIQKFQQLKSGGLFVIATFISQVFNFLFNMYLGRQLPFEHFALITVVINIWYFILIILNALSFAITNRTAYLEKNSGKGSIADYYSFFLVKTLQISSVAAAIWIVISPLLMHFFHISDWYSILMISPLIIAGAILSINRGFLQGRMLFTQVSIILIVESVIRLLFAVLIVEAGFGHWSYVSIPLSLICALILSYVLIRPQIPPIDHRSEHIFPKKMFIALLLTGLSTTAFLTVDMLLVKHYFDDRIAGMYALLALTGKIIFFFSSLLNSVLFTYASQSGKESYNLFYKILAGTLVLIAISFVSFGLIGEFTTTLLLGEKAVSIFPYLLPYSAAIGLFAFTNTFITFHVARDEKMIAIISLGMASILMLSIAAFHASLEQIIYSILTVSGIGCIIVLFTHYIYKKYYAI